MENIIEEAKKFAENGVKELVIVAQDVTAYGIDLYKKYGAMAGTSSSGQRRWGFANRNITAGI